MKLWLTEGLVPRPGATGVLFFLILQLPPFKPANWISGRVEGQRSL